MIFFVPLSEQKVMFNERIDLPSVCSLLTTKGRMLFLVFKTKAKTGDIFEIRTDLGTL